MLLDVFGIFFLSRIAQVEFHNETKGEKGREKKDHSEFRKKI